MPSETDIPQAVLRSARLQQALSSMREAVDAAERRGTTSAEEALSVARLLREGAAELVLAAELLQRAVDWAAE